MTGSDDQGRMSLRTTSADYNTASSHFLGGIIVVAEVVPREREAPAAQLVCIKDPFSRNRLNRLWT